MQFSGSVWRWRRRLEPDPHNPSRMLPGRWSEADVVEVQGAAVLSSSASALQNEDRFQALAAKSLFLSDPLADVQRGDGVSLAPGGDGPEFTVEVVPTADVNPFTGWQPVREVPLKGADG